MVQVVTALLQKTPSSASAVMGYILPAAVAKLAVASSSPLIVALLAIFAQLIHVNVTQLVDYLAAMQSPSKDELASFIWQKHWLPVGRLEVHGLKILSMYRWHR